MGGVRNGDVAFVVTTVVTEPNFYRFQEKENHGEHGAHGGVVGLEMVETADFSGFDWLSFPVSRVLPVVNLEFLFLDLYIRLLLARNPFLFLRGIIRLARTCAVGQAHTNKAS